MNMKDIQYGTLTNQISLKSQGMMKALADNDIKGAETFADDIARMIYQYRKLSEALQVDEIL